jgi:hypothetical protein
MTKFTLTEAILQINVLALSQSKGVKPKLTGSVLRGGVNLQGTLKKKAIK